MVKQHYRWDFIGLSTDTKPTPETNEKVVDGSTFYCSDTSKLYVFCKDTWYEKKPMGGGGGGGTTYTAGNGIDIEDDTISVDTSEVQEKLTAGSNVTISDENVISATDTTYTAGTNITISGNEISATDTTYSNFVGTDGVDAGTAGLVPAPATTDAGKFLKADGTWDTAGGGSGPTVVQTTGTSTTDVMSQVAATKLVFTKGDAATAGINIGQGNMNTLGGSADFKPITIGVKAKADKKYNSIAIGSASDGLNPSAAATGEASIAIGSLNTKASGVSSVAIGSEANVSGNYSVGIGANSSTSRHSTVSVGNGTAGTDYGTRYIANVRNPSQDQDAATKNYVDTKILISDTAPTTSTVGVLGQLYTDTSTMHTYQCTDTTGGVYTWTQRW